MVGPGFECPPEFAGHSDHPRRPGLALADRRGPTPRRTVVVTMPAPQLADLIGADHPPTAPLASARIEPCLSLTAAVAALASVVTRNDQDDPLARLARDSSEQGRPSGGAVAWVVKPCLLSANGI